MSVHFSSEKSTWETPQDLFDELDAEFNFTTDVCATGDNAKVAEFIDPAQDGLSQSWDGTCWMNPPYGITRSLLPFKKFQRSHFLIGLLSKFGLFVRDSKLFASGDLHPVKIFNGKNSLFFFDDQVWKDALYDAPALFSGDGPPPRHALIELSGTLFSNSSDRKRVSDLFYAGLVRHFNEKLKAIDWGVVFSAGCSGVSLVDAYASFPVNDPGCPDFINFHNVMCSYVEGFIELLHKTKVYGIGSWIKKASDEAEKGCTVVCLIPYRPDTGYWFDYIWEPEEFGGVAFARKPREGVEVRALKGRLKFGGAKNSAPFPSAIVIFRGKDETD